MNCPNNHGEMKILRALEGIAFRGKELEVPTEHYICAECGLKVDDLVLAARNQRALADTYRSSVSMLTSNEIAEGRKKYGWTQEQLAKAINVGIASIKRWETGQIQTKAMDDSLRRVFEGHYQSCDPYTGNRELSFERIKLVLGVFSAKLGRKLLKNTKTDKLLYAGKYLWFADMIAFREIGQSMTGATYARLPQGPQLNNYEDLVSFIREADENAAEPLTDHEQRIIERIASKFPNDQDIYEASHQEKVWLERKNGQLMPYFDAEKLSI